MNEGFVNSLIATILSMLGPKKKDKVEVGVSIPLESSAPVSAPVTDWTDPKSQVTEHFTVGDALILHSWNRLATVADGADFDKLTTLCQKMEEIRNILGCPINVHCCFRSQTYNTSQNISPANDVHAQNLACDFDCSPHLTIEEVKNQLLPMLDTLQIRLEKGTTTWCHVDLHAVGPSGRYFTP